MNILETIEMLKRMPDADLMQTQSPDVSEWMRAMEINRRNRTRQGERTGTGAPPTVAQQLTQQISRQQPIATQVPQPGAQSQFRGIGSMPQGAPKGYAAGGIVTFKDGGLVAAAKTFGYDATDEADAQAWLEKTRYSSTDPRIRAGVASALQREIEQQSGIRAATEVQREAAITADPSRLSRYTSRGELIRPEFAAPQAQAGIPAAVAPPATTQPPPAVDKQLTSAIPARVSQPGSAVSGIGEVRGPQIAMPEKPIPAADVNVPTRAGELAAYYGEDEYGKAVAADLAERRKQAAAAKEKDLGWAMIEGGLAGMVEGGKSGATFLGTVGAGGIKALEGQKAREAARSAEESAMGKEVLGEVGRKQTERRGYTTAALGEAKEVAKENREALSKYADRVQEATFKNAELKNTITGYLIQADTQLRSHERALDRADQQQAEADRNAMKQLVILAQKDVEAARDTPDYPVAKKAYEELFNSYKSMLPAKPTPAPSVKKGKVVADLSS